MHAHTLTPSHTPSHLHSHSACTHPHTLTHTLTPSQPQCVRHHHRPRRRVQRDGPDGEDVCHRLGGIGDGEKDRGHSPFGCRNLGG